MYVACLCIWRASWNHTTSFSYFNVELRTLGYKNEHLSNSFKVATAWSFLSWLHDKSCLIRKPLRWNNRAMIYNSTGRSNVPNGKAPFQHRYTSLLQLSKIPLNLYFSLFECFFSLIRMGSTISTGQHFMGALPRPGAFTGPNSRVDRRSTRRSGRSAEATGRDFSALRGVCCGQDWWKASASLGQAWRWVERLGVEKGGGLWCLWWVGSWRMKDWMRLNYVKVRLDDM